MGKEHRKQALTELENEAKAYFSQREAAIREFASNLAKERAILNDAERENGDQFREEIRQARDGFDDAEREFYEQSEQALRDFNAAIQEARRSIG